MKVLETTIEKPGRLRMINRNGIYYIEIKTQRVSLKTKDPEIARQKAAIIANELAVIDAYTIVFNQLEKAKQKLEIHYQKLANMIGLSQGLIDQNKNITGWFDCEDEFQAKTLPVLTKQYGLDDVQTFVACPSGILDGVATHRGKKVILEFKYASISEDQLGQCLRYLGDEKINADSLWLIGLKQRGALKVYKEFPQIVPMVCKKNEAKKIYFKPLYEHHDLLLGPKSIRMQKKANSKMEE